MVRGWVYFILVGGADVDEGVARRGIDNGPGAAQLSRRVKPGAEVGKEITMVISNGVQKTVPDSPRGFIGPFLMYFLKSRFTLAP